MSARHTLTPLPGRLALARLLGWIIGKWLLGLSWFIRVIRVIVD